MMSLCSSIANEMIGKLQQSLEFRLDARIYLSPPQMPWRPNIDIQTLVDIEVGREKFYLYAESIIS